MDGQYMVAKPLVCLLRRSTSERPAIAPYSPNGARAQEADMAIKMTRGSGNVFTDLGFPAAEAANLQLRSTLMIQLRKRLTARGATQAQAARLLGVSQPHISDLYRGKIERFSVDTLIAMLDKTGADVRVTVRNRTTAA